MFELRGDEDGLQRFVDFDRIKIRFRIINNEGIFIYINIYYKIIKYQTINLSIIILNYKWFGLFFDFYFIIIYLVISLKRRCNYNL